MAKAIISAILGLMAGLLLMAALAKSAVEARDRAILSFYIASQSQSARTAIAENDLIAADRHQQNAIEAAERGLSELAIDVAPWGLWFPVATGIVSTIASDADSDAKVRRQQEYGMRMAHADILERLGRVEEAAKQRKLAASLKP